MTKMLRRNSRLLCIIAQKLEKLNRKLMSEIGIDGNSAVPIWDRTVTGAREIVTDRAIWREGAA